MPETYGDYAMLKHRRSGLLYSGNAPASQWAWTPQLDGSSWISWGNPAAASVPYREHFLHDGEWVVLDGWEDNGTYYTQRVTTEQIGGPSGTNLVPLPLREDRREQYAKWVIPTTGYTLKSWGTITEESSGKVVDFGHTQMWYPPAVVFNRYLGDHKCIRQWEAWWDNNGTPGTPITRKLERTIRYGLGIGPGYLIEQWYPGSWKAELRCHHWTWCD